MDIEASDTMDKVKGRRADHKISVQVSQGVGGVDKCNEGSSDWDRTELRDRRINCSR